MYAYKRFADKHCEKGKNFYLHIAEIYYDLMSEHSKIIMENKTLVNFYVKCYLFIQNDKLVNVLQYADIQIIYFLLDNLENKNGVDNFLKILSKQETLINQKLGLLILPIFNTNF